MYLSSPTALPEGTTSVKPVAPASEPAIAVWLGERKGAPASVALYTLSSLLPKSADGEKTETRDMPMTMARKAFYKADKLNVKWNAAGTMVSSCFLKLGRADAGIRPSSSHTPMWTNLESRTMARRTCICSLWTGRSIAWWIWVRQGVWRPGCL